MIDLRALMNAELV